MSKDLIVDRKYLSYVKALNYYEGKSCNEIQPENINEGFILNLGKLSNLKDLNLFVFLLSSKILTTDKNSFSSNLSDNEHLMIDSRFTKGFLNVLYDTNRKPIKEEVYNIYLKFKVKESSYLNYLIEVITPLIKLRDRNRCFVNHTEEVFRIFIKHIKNI